MTPDRPGWWYGSFRGDRPEPVKVYRYRGEFFCLGERSSYQGVHLSVDHAFWTWHGAVPQVVLCHDPGKHRDSRQQPEAGENPGQEAIFYSFEEVGDVPPAYFSEEREPALFLGEANPYDD